jgi:hypothetical protein
VVRLRFDKVDLVVKAKFVDERMRLGRLYVTITSTGTANQYQLHVITFNGGKRSDRHVRALERLDPANEQNEGTVDIKANRVTGSFAGARRKESAFDAGRNDLDAASRIAVQPTKLLFLFCTTDANAVGALDDLGFGPVTPKWLRVATFSFHTSKGVERRDERHAEFVLEVVADDAA